MMFRELFHLGVYKESLRRSRNLGLIYLIFEILATGVMCFAEVVDQLSYASMDEVYVTTLSAMNLVPFHYVIAYCGAPCFVLLVFAWMNKRNESDYYHSIPATRRGIYISGMAAVLTWTLVDLLIPTLFGCLLTVILSRFITVSITSVVIYTWSAFVSAFFLAMITGFAMTITGTAFTNVSLTLAILFVPYGMMLFVSYLVSSLLPMVKLINMLGVFTEYLPSPIAQLQNLMADIGIGVSSAENPAFHAGCIGMTLLLGMVMFFFSLLLFCKRRSETAEKSAPNRTMQTVYRLTFSFPICLCSVGYGYFCLVRYGYLSITERFLCIVFFLVGVVVYFVYELITTKKWKNLLKAIPALGILLGLSVLSVLFMWGVRAYHISYTPSSSAIASFSVLDENDDYYYDFETYAENLQSKVYCSNQEAIAILTKALAENIAIYRISYTDYRQEYILSKWVDGSYVRNYTSIYVSLKGNNGITHSRVIYLTKDNYNRLFEILADNEEFMEVWSTLPTPINSSTIRIHSLASTPSAEELATLWQYICQDMENMDAIAWYNRMANGTLVEGATPVERTTISYSISRNGKVKTKNLDIYSDLMPNASTYIRELIFQYESVSVAEVLEDLNTKNIEYWEVALYVPYEDFAYRMAFLYRFDEALDEGLYEILSTYGVDQVRVDGESFVWFYYEYVDEEGVCNYVSRTIPLKDFTWDLLPESWVARAEEMGEEGIYIEDLVTIYYY